MKLEILEEKVKHDIWGSEIHVTLSDSADASMEAKRIMARLRKYFTRQYVVLKNGKKIEEKV